MKIISTKLPKNVIREVSSCDGAVLTMEGDTHTLDISNSEDGMGRFKRYLTTYPTEVDPLIIPTFGGPEIIYLPPAAQREVHSLLRTYQHLRADDIATREFPFIQADVIVPRGGYIYDHATMAIDAVMEEISCPTLFAAYCPGITSVLPGQVICDLTLVYANVVVFLRIHKLFPDM